MNKQFLIHGALPGFGSALCFAVMASLIKIAAQDLSSQQLVFFRAVIGLIIILPIIIYKGFGFIKTNKLKLHIFRGLVSICAMSCFFYSISHIGISEATLLNATSPLFIGLLASWFLKEKLDGYSLVALPLGFIGVAFILKPGTELFNIASVIGLASGLFIGGAKILVRYMSDTEPVLRTVFYFSVFSTIYAAIPMLWLWQPPTQQAIYIMILASICATGGQTLLTYSFTHNEAISVAPFTYVTVMIATLIGWIVWNELPDLGSTFGIILVIVSCLIIIMQKKLPNPWKKKQPPV